MKGRTAFLIGIGSGLALLMALPWLIVGYVNYLEWVRAVTQ